MIQGFEMIGRGVEADVYLEPGGKVVRKVFCYQDPGVARFNAERTYTMLGRVSDVLQTVPGVRCPTPVELLLTAPPTVRMEACAGINLRQYLLEGRLRGLTEAQQIARRVAMAVVRYTQELQEPYYDFRLANVLWDVDSRTVVILDFSVPSRLQVGAYAALSPLEVSLGNFIGLTGYEEFARPSALRRRVSTDQLLLFERLVVRHVFGLAGSMSMRLTLRGVARAAWLTYARIGTPGLHTLRGLWYGSVGTVLFHYGLRRLLTEPSADALAAVWAAEESASA